LQARAPQGGVVQRRHAAAVARGHARGAHAADEGANDGSAAHGEKGGAAKCIGGGGGGGAVLAPRKNLAESGA